MLQTYQPRRGSARRFTASALACPTKNGRNVLARRRLKGRKGCPRNKYALTRFNGKLSLP